MPTSLFVGRLPRSFDDRDLRELFAEYRNFSNCKVKRGMRFGYGFVDFEDYDEACYAIRNVNNISIAGARIVVELARKDPERSSKCYNCHEYGHFCDKCPKREYRQHNTSYIRDFRDRSMSPYSSRYRHRKRSRSPRQNQRSRSRDNKRRYSNSPREHLNARKSASQDYSDSSRRSYSDRDRSRSYSRSPSPTPYDRYDNRGRSPSHHRPTSPFEKSPSRSEWTSRSDKSSNRKKSPHCDRGRSYTDCK